MATSVQLNRLRNDMGLNPTNPPEPDLQDLYTRASEDYPDLPKVQEAWVRVLLLQQLMVAAAKRVDYVANAFQIKASQVFDHLNLLYPTHWANFLFQLEYTGTSVVVDMRPLARPSYLTEYPNED